MKRSIYCVASALALINLAALSGCGKSGDTTSPPPDIREPPMDMRMPPPPPPPPPGQPDLTVASFSFHIYMAPEQCRGSGEVDGKADVYSLGVMLYEILVGRPPFVAEGIGELMARHMYEPARPLWEIDPMLPAELVTLVHAMLTKAPAERPAMVQVAAALAGVMNRLLVPGPFSASGHGEQLPRARRRSLWPLLFGVALSGAALLAGLASRRHAVEQAPSPPSPPAHVRTISGGAPAAPAAPRAEEVPPPKGDESHALRVRKKKTNRINEETFKNEDIYLPKP